MKEKKNCYENPHKNLKNLKGIEGYGKMSITEDHTKAKCELIKTWANKAKELNAKEPNGTCSGEWEERNRHLSKEVSY